MTAAARPRKRAARGQGATLYGEVLRAAMDLLAETGSVDAVSVRSVAQRVGVSVPSIYLHFADKQALIDAVCEQVFADLDEAMQQASRDAVDPFEALRMQGVAYIRFALENPEQYRVVMMSPPVGKASGPVEAMSMSAFAHILEGVEACLATSVLEGDPITICMQLWAAAHGIASLMIAKPEFPWPPVEQFVDDSICAAGLGLAVLTRLDRDLPLDELRARLDALRST